MEPDPIEPSHYAAMAVNHLREQHKQESALLRSYDDVSLRFDASLQPSVKKLLLSMCNKNTYDRKVPEGADAELVLRIANLHLPESGQIILPDNKERNLTDFTGGEAQFTRLDQLAALGQEVVAHPAVEAPATAKPKSSGRRAR